MSTILDYMVNSGKTPPGKLQLIRIEPPASTASSKPNVLQPQVDSNMGKQIMQNMESVIKSLKRRKKHKKHRQKKATKIPDQVESVVVVREDKEESEEEPLSSLKKSWLTTRRPSGDQKDSVALKTESPKNAFALLMLNGKTAQVSPGTSTNDENQHKKISPEGGKRKLPSGRKEPVKRRKLKGVSINDGSPKSPVKKRRKKKLFECYLETIEAKKQPPSPLVVEQVSDEDDNDDEEEDVVISTPSRPRRSCANNVSYIEISPVSSKKPQNSKVLPAVVPVDARKKTVVIPESSPNIIDLEKSPLEAIDVEKNKRLAPLFYKALPKPTVDPKILEARQSFLKSDIPEKLRQEMEKKKQMKEEVNARQLSLFPEISHVPQSSRELYLEMYDEDQLFPRQETIHETPPPHSYSLPRLKERILQGYADLVLSPLKSEAQKKQLVRNLKADKTGKFPAYLFYNVLAKRNKSVDYVASLFTEKFKPSTASEFVFNLTAINEVKEYLESFNSPASDGNASSYDTDDDDCSNSMDAFGSGARQTLVLHGPRSTGKTSAVYAIAQELNYNVIEINASSKRNGSKMLHKLMEATQSHKVPTAKMSLNRKILRRMEREEKKMSIIFIEDVDLIFADDHGFLAAITQLMSLTKRPIILTTNNRDSANLKKFFDASQNFKFLPFRRPDQIEDSIAYLHLVGIVNGCNIHQDYLRHLLERHDRDMRQVLLQLNFLTMTKEIDFKWSAAEKATLDVPCIKWEAVEETDWADYASSLDNLCSAEVWSSRGLDEMEEEFQEMCSLGGSLLVTGYDGTFSKKTECRAANPISNHLNHPMKSTKALAVDVEPFLRAICLSEFNRKEVQRSTSKFSHYLLREMDLDWLVFGADRLTKEEMAFLNESCTIFK